MSVGPILTLLFVTLILAVVTTSVLQENRAYRRRQRLMSGKPGSTAT